MVKVTGGDKLKGRRQEDAPKITERRTATAHRPFGPMSPLRREETDNRRRSQKHGGTTSLAGDKTEGGHWVNERIKEARRGGASEREVPGFDSPGGVLSGRAGLLLHPGGWDKLTGEPKLARGVNVFLCCPGGNKAAEKGWMENI